MTNKPLFPKDFMWGASTASHQVEGNTNNQWTQWELQNAAELAKTAKQRLDWIPAWDDVKDQATKPENYVSGEGVQHLIRYKEDFDLLKKLQLNSFRFGIEWSRLQPKQGEFDQAVVEHYRTYLQELKKRGIEPVLNIWHWTHPLWFDELGGWTKRKNIKYFEEYVQKIADEFANEITYVITLNEPNVYTAFSFLNGEWPPQKRNWWIAYKVYGNLAYGHKCAYKILKHRKPSLQIGVAAQLANVQAKRPHAIIDGITTQWMRYYWNWQFLNRIRNHQDYVGFNYYFSDYYKGLWRKNPEVPKSDLGWYMEPEGLYPLLLRVWAHYKKPMIITENGVADANDQYRQWWLAESVVAMERALSEGVELKGYFHWSLLDNFEWRYGWWPKFGLIEVDREHGFKRTIRPSAKWWANWLKNLDQ